MTEDLRTIACPDAEQLAEYVEGRLTANDRARVEEHLADCEMCREVVANVARALPPKVVPLWRRPGVVGGALALAASLAIAVGVQWNPFHRPTPYEELVAAVGTNRTVEGRLSGGFQYGPLRSATRSGERSSNQLDVAVLAAAAKIERDAEAAPTADHLHALGVARLVTGDLDRAIDALQDAADLQLERADIQSDLAAALLMRGTTRNRPRDLALALAAAERAIHIAPTLVEPYFNRALALEALNLVEERDKAWREYLLRDPNSNWSAEGLRRIKPNSSDLSPNTRPNSELDTGAFRA